MSAKKRKGTKKRGGGGGIKVKIVNRPPAWIKEYGKTYYLPEYAPPIRPLHMKKRKTKKKRK